MRTLFNIIMKNINLLLLLLFAFTFALNAQDYEVGDYRQSTAQGSLFTSGNGFINIVSGEFYGYENDAAILISLNGNLSYFPINRLAVGAKFSLETLADDTESSSITTIGPEISYFLDNDSQFLPYAFASASLLTFRLDTPGGSGEANGSRLDFGGGLIYRIGPYLGVNLKGGLQFDRININRDKIKGRVLFVSIGLAGFVF